MFETSHNDMIRAAYRKAHAERAEAFVGVFKWIFARRDVPLSRPVLTEQSRCA